MTLFTRRGSLRSFLNAGFSLFRNFFVQKFEYMNFSDLDLKKFFDTIDGELDEKVSNGFLSSSDAFFIYFVYTNFPISGCPIPDEAAPFRPLLLPRAQRTA